MTQQTNEPVLQFERYEQALEWVTSQVAFGIKPGLMRIERLMERLGNPQRRLKFIHVAGTNGKGSTCAFLSKVLIHSGYDVGTFTSPYIEKFTNRIELNGKPIPEQEVVTYLNQIKPICNEIAQSELGHPTMFEIVIALALQYYATSAYPDYIVWETGLGGRLDCTNIVTPIVSVITNVGHDHMDILGDTIEQIAAEKAGIIKPGVPVISTVDQPEVIRVITQAAEQNKSTLYLLDKQFSFKPLRSTVDEQSIDFIGPFRELKQVPVSLNGRHQMKNAAAALMTLEVLRQYYATLVDEEHIIDGMGQTKWPGRLEMVSQSPRILLDGAHNPEGAAVLVDALQDVYSYENVHVMIGMLNSKKHQAFLGHLLPHVNTLIITEPNFRNKMEASELLHIAERIANEMGRQIRLILEPSWEKALQILKDMTQPDELAVVTGTLYLISDVRSSILQYSHSEKGW